MATKKFHLQEQDIPPGFQIFEERLEVAGVKFRKDEAAAFAQSRRNWLELERDEHNEHDRNAIKVIGCSKGFFGSKRRFIGYVPKGVSRQLIENGFWSQVKPRLLKTYIGDGGFVEILFQILGPDGKRKEYRKV